MSMMKRLFLSYWNVGLLKESPANTPYSLLLLLSGMLFLNCIMVIQWRFSDFEVATNLMLLSFAGISLVSSFVIYTAGLLYFKGLKARLLQTATTLLFVHSIIHIMAMPLFLIDPYLSHANLKNPLFLFIGVLYLFVTLGLSIWQFVVTAHIYKCALNTTLTQSVLAAFGLVAVNVLTLSFWR